MAYIKDTVNKNQEEQALHYLGNKHVSFCLSIYESIFRNAMKDVTL